MEGFKLRNEKIPEWKRIYFVDEDGTVMLPCGAFGNEMEAFLCLGFDGAPFVRHDGHIYAPATWLAGLHSNIAGHIEDVVDKVHRRHRLGIHRTTGSDETTEQDMAAGQGMVPSPEHM